MKYLELLNNSIFFEYQNNLFEKMDDTDFVFGFANWVLFLFVMR